MNEAEEAKGKAREVDWYIRHPDHWSSRKRDLDADRRCYQWCVADCEWYRHYAAVAQSAIDIVRQKATEDGSLQLAEVDRNRTLQANEVAEAERAAARADR
eukprot:1450974-Alexandrium_andersonii.AAC.1